MSLFTGKKTWTSWTSSTCKACMSLQSEAPRGRSRTWIPGRPVFHGSYTSCDPRCGMLLGTDGHLRLDGSGPVSHHLFHHSRRFLLKYIHTCGCSLVHQAARRKLFKSDDCNALPFLPPHKNRSNPMPSTNDTSLRFSCRTLPRTSSICSGLSSGPSNSRTFQGVVGVVLTRRWLLCKKATTPEHPTHSLNRVKKKIG